MTSQYHQGRIEWIELTKGLAIFLVVLGHLFKYGGSLPVPEFYTILKIRIYDFHMPLFMFLSGCVYFYRSYHIQNSLSDLTRMVLKRADRLLVPFFGLAILTISAKAVLRHWFYVEESNFSLADSLSLIFVNTESSPVFTIWYLFVLFVFASVTPLLFKAVGNRYYVLLLCSIAMYFIDAPDICYLNRVLSFYVFFMLGGLFSSGNLPLGQYPRYVFFGAVAAFVASLIPDIGRFSALFVCGTLSCVAIPGIVVAARGYVRQALLFLAENTMAIYLFNVASIGLVKAVYVKTFSYSIHQFYILAPLMLSAGVLLPVLVKQTLSSILATRPVAKYLV